MKKGSMKQGIKIFISHSHADHLLAKAFDDFIKKIFVNSTVMYSSDRTPGGGVKEGGNWLQWIYDQVLTADETFILLTPNSYSKAWPMWESGAAAGVVLGREYTAKASGKKAFQFPATVKPIAFKLPAISTAGPFATTQITKGTDEAGLRKLFGELLMQYDQAKTINQKKVVENLLNAEIPEFIASIQQALRNTPQLITEDVVQEWLHRLSDLQSKGRSREVGNYHKWISLMFEGPESIKSEDGESYKSSRWDLRLHLRLGEMYLNCRNFNRAIEQFEHAREMAPLDIFVLHKLGMAHLNNEDLEKADMTLSEIITLDHQATDNNAEVAGFKGRLFKEKAKIAKYENKSAWVKEYGLKAREAYEAALNNDRNAYYLADNVGQCSLMMEDIPSAQIAYAKVKEILQGNANDGIWQLASAANAEFALRNPVEGIKLLRVIRTHHPSDLDISSIKEGLKVVQEGMKYSQNDYQEWCKVFDE